MHPRGKISCIIYYCLLIQDSSEKNGSAHRVLRCYFFFLKTNFNTGHMTWNVLKGIYRVIVNVTVDVREIPLKNTVGISEKRITAMSTFKIFRCLVKKS